MYTSITIEEVELYKLKIPLKEPFIISLGAFYDAENVVVKIKTKEGITGFGESSPFMTIHGESIDTCYVVGQYFAKIFKGKDALAIGDRIKDMDALIYGNGSIKSAFDMALYDIAAQNAGLPLYQFLGGKKDKTIVTDYTVSIGEPEKMAKDALSILNEGYPFIKIKLGRHGETDVIRIKAIREAVGNDIPLYVDANQGWQVEEAISTLKELHKLGVKHCEEPIAKWDILNLPKVKAESPVPIMADESCSSPHDAEKLVALNACDYFNIKIGKSGGIYNALKIVDVAAKANIHLQVGAFMESRLAMSAFAHFSLCHPLIEHFDFDTALMFKEDPVTGGIVYKENGRIEVPDTPGLGATIAQEKLNEFESITI